MVARHMKKTSGCILQLFCNQRIIYNTNLSQRISLSVSRLFSTSTPLLRRVKNSKKSKKVQAESIERTRNVVKKEADPYSAGIPQALHRIIKEKQRSVDSSKISVTELQECLEHSLRALRPHEKMQETSSLYKGELPTEINLGYMKTEYKTFKHLVLDQSAEYSPSGANSCVPTRQRLKAVFARRGFRGVNKFLRNCYLEHIGYKASQAEDQTATRFQDAADARFPQEWFVNTRQTQRTWHLHIGPTNSGKTYNALKRLEKSGNGIYAGPLRLLAYEIFERMNAKGIPCNLCTGDDIRTVDENALLQSSTMEMVDMGRTVDVCVIDEIQMIGDDERGWAWTQAVLGVKAKELHLCGEERTVELIQRLAASVGDELIIHRYKRLGPLEVMPKSLEGDLTKIEDGDCVVTFTRRNIFALKRSIEETTGKRCAVVYGSLPPETRSTQATLFNDPDSEYKVLVASDAVGMGLNLSIKRVVFEATSKWNGYETIAVPVPSVKQIAGRAGRYRVHTKGVATGPEVKKEEIGVPLPAAPLPGYVTTLDETDLRSLTTAMKTEPPQIKTAGILPLPQHFVRFAAQFEEGTPFSAVLRALESFVSTSNLFHACSLRESIQIAELLDHITDLTVEDRLTFIQAPIGSTPESKLAFKRFAEAVANNENGSILTIPGIDIEALDIPAEAHGDLKRLEILHKVLIMYLWLSYRFPATFSPRETAQELKAICETKIEACLSQIRFTRTRRNRAKLTKIDPNAAPLTTGDKLSPEDLQKDLEKSENAIGSDIKAYKRVEPMVCFRCGQAGHMSRNCPRGGQRSDQKCFLCGQTGHRKAECPNQPNFRTGAKTWKKSATRQEARA